MYSRKCVGGPLNGKEVQSRFPKGFLLVNRPEKQIALYDLSPVGTWQVRQDNDTWRMPEITDEAEAKNRYRAALEPNYDVLAYDPEEMPPWE